MNSKDKLELIELFMMESRDEDNEYSDGWNDAISELVYLIKHFGQKE